MFLLLLLAAAPAPDSVRELAGKVLALLAPRETVTLSVRNLSSLGPEDTAAVGRELENRLRATNIVLAADAPVAIAVTLSENAQGPVWIAEIRRGDKRDVVMTVPAMQAGRAAKTSATIERELLMEQDEPILDAAPAGDALIVLDQSEVVVYRRGQRHSASTLPRKIWPRDLRGRLELEGDSLRVFLPGVLCTGKWMPEITLACSDSDASLAKSRNYFAEDNLPPYYTAARTPEYSLLAGMDGRVHLLDSTAAAFAGWGSDIAAVQTVCGSRVLATGPGGADETDSVQGFEIVGREPVAATPAMEFPGPVTALWPAGQSSAVAISRDLKTGQYAAFRLTVICSC